MRIETAWKVLPTSFLKAATAYMLRPYGSRSSKVSFHSIRLCLRLPDMNVGERLQQPKDIQQPEHHSYDYDSVQD